MTVPAGARAAPPSHESASLVAAPDYELAYLLDRDDYNYKSAGSLASGSADTVLLVGSVMGEAYQVDLNIGIVPIPRSYAAAVANPVDGAKWRAACDDDYKGKYTLLKTWELVKSIPLGRRVIKGKWVFSVKYKTDGTVDKFKARYVGLTQRAARRRARRIGSDARLAQRLLGLLEHVSGPGRGRVAPSVLKVDHIAPGEMAGDPME